MVKKKIEKGEDVRNEAVAKEIAESQEAVKKENQKIEKEPGMKELLQRTQASFENYRKQTDKRIEEMEEFAARNVILKLLPVLDNFELALKSVDTNSNPEDFLKGIELIYAQFNTFLEDSGVESIKTEKEQFDPYYHEALMKVASELPENIIIEEFQKGFTLHGKIIRHAKVKVSAGMEKASSDQKKVNRR